MKEIEYKEIQDRLKNKLKNIPQEFITSYKTQTVYEKAILSAMSIVRSVYKKERL